MGLQDVRLVGCDLPLHTEPSRYREVVERIKRDERSVGALITAHKIDVFESCRDLIDEVDADAELCGETSCLVRRGETLSAHATDLLSSARAFDDFHARTPLEVLCLGAGGSSTAITVQLIRRRLATRITVVDRSAAQLARIRAVHDKLDPYLEVRYVETEDSAANDRLLSELPSGSLVVNATGLGKDLPGSPLTDQVEFPEDGYAWDVNYRGQLQFLRQARGQREFRRLHVEDGWRYFIHGWAVVMGWVFDIEMGPGQTASLVAVSENEHPG